MTTLVNFRVDAALRDAAAARAKRIGLPLSIVFRTLLASFAHDDSPIVFGNIAELEMPPHIVARALQVDASLDAALKAGKGRKRTVHKGVSEKTHGISSLSL